MLPKKDPSDIVFEENVEQSCSPRGPYPDVIRYTNIDYIPYSFRKCSAALFLIREDDHPLGLSASDTFPTYKRNQWDEMNGPMIQS